MIFFFYSSVGTGVFHKKREGGGKEGSGFTCQRFLSHYRNDEHRGEGSSGPAPPQWLKGEVMGRSKRFMIPPHQLENISLTLRWRMPPEKPKPKLANPPFVPKEGILYYDPILYCKHFYGQMTIFDNVMTV